MRKTISTLSLIALVAGIGGAIPTRAAEAAGLPVYSSVVDGNASAFTVSAKKLGKTAYVTCELPAPVECAAASDQQEKIWGELDGTVYRNEAGTLQVTAETDNNVTLTAHEWNGRTWKESGDWTAIGGVSRVLVANDGKHFVAFMADGTVSRYAIGSTKPLSTATYNGSGSATTLSSTGRYLAYYRPATASTKQRTYTVADLSAGKEVSWSEPVAYWDLVSEDNRVFSFNATDTKLVLRSDNEGWQKPYLVNLAAGLPTTLLPTALFARPYSVPDFVFIDETRLALVANRESATAWNLYVLDVNTLDILKVADNASYGVALRRFGDYVSFARTVTGGVSAALYNVKTGSVTGIESLAETGLAAGDAVPAAKVVKNVAGAGGYSVWEPATRTAATPIVLWLHGGPYRQTATTGYHPFSSYGSFDWMLEQVRQSGAVVAKLDYPGSYGYGRAYAESLTGNVGTTDVASVQKAITELRATYGANAPVYLIGNSYGGYLAQKALVDLNSQVQGIYSISGVTDWEELIVGYPEGIFATQFQGPRTDANVGLYQKAKLILGVDKIGNQRVLIAHGDADTSVPLSQSRLISEVMKVAGKNVEFTTYAGENHVFANPANVADLCKKAIGLIGKDASGRCAI